MTGAEYANLVASYIAKRFATRGLTVYREVRVGKTIIGKDRCIDVFCVSRDSQKAFAIECKFQDSQGTVDEKIPYALDDVKALPMAGCIVYAGQGFFPPASSTCSRHRRMRPTACRSRIRTTRRRTRASSIICSRSTSAGGTFW